MFTCPTCPNEYDKLISLSLHFRKSHKKTAKDLYIALYCNGAEPTCKCGCGGVVKFLDTTRGFSEYVWGHAAKVPGKNNWGNNAKAKEKSLETRRDMLEDGTWKPFTSNETGEHWNTGLTKDTDSRLLQMSERIKANPEEVRKRSERMIQNWKTGVFVPLKKEDIPSGLVEYLL
jgi:hypothetical protein